MSEGKSKTVDSKREAEAIEMTDELWEELEDSLSLFSTQHLLIDGYKIGLQLRRAKGLKLVIMVFVDGVFKHKWLHEEGNELRRRFYWKRSKYAVSKKFRDAYVKHLGKRKAKKDGYFDKVNWWMPWFESFRTMKRTLKRNNESIKWLKDD